MKIVFQFARILVFCFLGEVLHAVLPLPVPASIYGLILLLAALRIGLIRPEQVRETAHFLTGIFLLLFIPGTVGIIEQLDVFLRSWLPVVITLLPVTFIVFAVSGRTTEKMLRRKDHA